eukprot:286988-Alexandrium_andersonii.AAC.1
MGQTALPSTLGRICGGSAAATPSPDPGQILALAQASDSLGVADSVALVRALAPVALNVVRLARGEGPDRDQDGGSPGV